MEWGHYFWAKQADIIYTKAKDLIQNGRCLIWVASLFLLSFCSMSNLSLPDLYLISENLLGVMPLTTAVISKASFSPSTKLTLTWWGCFQTKILLHLMRINESSLRQCKRPENKKSFQGRKLFIRAASSFFALFRNISVLERCRPISYI